MKKILIVLLLLVSLCGCINNSSIDKTKEETNDEALTIIKGDTIEDLHLFDNIESIVIDVIGSRDEGFKLTFKNSEAQDAFIESIKGINSATYYDFDKEPNACYDEDGNEVFGAPCEEVADTHDWLDVAPIVTINYTNNKSVKIISSILTSAKNNGGLNINGINGNNERIVDLYYINDDFLIAKTVANLVKDKLVYVDTVNKATGAYSLTAFLQIVKYETDDFNIVNNKIDKTVDKELDSYWVDYFNDNFKITENSELLDSFPTEGEHIITLIDKNDNSYLVGYNSLSSYYLDNYEITIHN